MYFKKIILLNKFILFFLLLFFLLCPPFIFLNDSNLIAQLFFHSKFLFLVSNPIKLSILIFLANQK